MDAGRERWLKQGEKSVLNAQRQERAAILEKLKEQKGGAVINNRVRMGCRLASYHICFFAEIRISHFILC